ncbi:N-methyl-L-tryptophan oxidase [Halorubrum vacuolatum]|uniref:Sarcosine oxidase n=1 Tax=Halorubrum vacuolatum TaxID=63740 RepID=A0A238Y1F0_HALVU|nr:N-methyl-L-tryptophan oxidase [Halorubrum vacuolatum]SNR64109.1 sarcosine oxidase [Halorubrum vacuolatum]
MSHRGTDRHDVIVVGVGGVGSATVSHLARRGLDVLGLERRDVPHAMGSSHGSTRIIRRAQHEGAEYVPLADRAYECWRALEERSGRDLLTVTGSIHAGAPGTDLIGDVVSACDAADVPYERLDAPTVNDRFPGYDLPADFEVVFQSEGGFLDVERCVSAYVTDAHAAGATIRGRERVLDWSETGDGVRVRTNKRRYEADELVITAGSWAGELLPELAAEAVPVRAVMTWLQPTEPELFSPERFPVFVLRSHEEGGYGFPAYDVPGFKFGRSADPLEVVDPETMDRAPTAKDEELHRRFAERYFPAGAGPTLSLRTCVQSFSSDEEFVVGRVPGHDTVTVATGFSGHGFKFASMLGEVLADLAIDGKTDHDLSIHSVGRVL